jgi:adenosine deaminase
VVEAMVDGFSLGGREAAEAGTPIQVGALLCAMRQADRWEEVAGLVVRFRDAGVVGFDLAGPEAGFPPDRIPAAIGVLDGARAHRTVHAGEAAGIDSIVAALDGARAERLGHGVRIADEVAEDGTLGPVAQRVLDRQVPLEVARRPTCRPVPTRRWPGTPSACCTGWASRSPSTPTTG